MSSFGSPPSGGGGFGPPGGNPPGGGAFGPPGGGGGFGPAGGGYPPGGSAPGGGFGPGPGTPPAGGGPGSYGGQPGPSGPRTDALAIVAMVAGLLAIVGAIANLVTGVFGMCCPLCTIGGAVIGAMVAVPALAGIVTGGLSYKRTSEQPEMYGGKGLAITGIVTGAIALLMTVATIVAPWLGFGCMAATAPERPNNGTYDPAPFDPAPFDPAPVPSMDPAPVPSVDPAPDPQAGGQPAAGACARIAPCCRAYINAMGGSVPATTCDAYNDVTGMPDSVCESAISGYRSGLTAMNKAVPTECN